MHHHPSWNATPPPLLPRGGGSLPSQSRHGISRRECLEMHFTSRRHSSLDGASSPSGFGNPEEKEKEAAYRHGGSSDAPGRSHLSCSISQSSTASPYNTGSVYSDSSSQSSGASPAVPFMANSRATTIAGTDTVERAVVSSTPGSATATSTGKVKKKRIRLKTERRREQCRRNQARYRNKQKCSALELETSVEQLRNEVEQLRQQHAQSRHRGDLNRMRVPPEELVHEMSRLFRCGLNVGRDESLFSRARHLPALEEQVAFVTSVFDPELRFGNMRGRTHLLEQLRRFSTLFDEYETVLERITPAPPSDDSSEWVQTSFRMDLTVSTTTLRVVFPHLACAEHNELRWKMLGQRLRFAAATVFVFGRDGRVVDVSWTVDWIAALQTVLTIEETVVVLEHAQINKDALLTTTGEDDALAYSVPVRHAVRSSYHHEQEQEDDAGELLHDEQGDDYVML